MSRGKNERIKGRKREEENDENNRHRCFFDLKNPLQIDDEIRYSHLENLQFSRLKSRTCRVGLLFKYSITHDSGTFHLHGKNDPVESFVTLTIIGIEQCRRNSSWKKNSLMDMFS